MTTDKTNPSSSRTLQSWRDNGWLKAVAVLTLLFMFLVGVNGLSGGFKSLGSGFVDGFFNATENPLIALMVGILATTIVQSSSVTTSLIVALVAAPDNPLAVSNAIPMIMGSNIGTTVKFYLYKGSSKKIYTKIKTTLYEISGNSDKNCYK